MSNYIYLHVYGRKTRVVVTQESLNRSPSWRADRIVQLSLLTYRPSEEDRQDRPVVATDNHWSTYRYPTSPGRNSLDDTPQDWEETSMVVWSGPIVTPIHSPKGSCLYCRSPTDGTGDENCLDGFYVSFPSVLGYNLSRLRGCKFDNIISVQCVSWKCK